MALSDASDDPLALSNGGHCPPSANGNAPSNTSTPVSSGQDPLTASSSGDCPMPAGDVVGKDVVCTVQQKQQRLQVVQRTNRSSQSQNGSVVKQNGSLRTLSPSSAAASSPSIVTDSQRLATRHLPSPLSPSSSSSPVLPVPLCCQHCHFHSTLCCPCGQQECRLFQSPATSPGPSTIPHAAATSSCPCCLSACPYSHHQPHPPHSTSPLCVHHHHQQHWQEHLQNQTLGLRYFFVLFCD